MMRAIKKLSVFLVAEFNAFRVRLLQLVDGECFDDWTTVGVAACDDILVDDLVAAWLDFVTAGLPGSVEASDGGLVCGLLVILGVAFHHVLVRRAALGPLASQTAFDRGAVVGIVTSDQSVRWFLVFADGAFVHAVLIDITITIFQPLVGVNASDAFDRQTTVVLRAHVPERILLERIANVDAFAFVLACNRAHGAGVVRPSSAFVEEFTFLFRLADVVSFAFVRATSDVHSQMITFGRAAVPIFVVFPAVTRRQFFALFRDATFVTEAQETASVDDAFQDITAALERLVKVHAGLVVGETSFRRQLTVLARVPVTAAVHLGSFLEATCTALLAYGGVVGGVRTIDDGE